SKEMARTDEPSFSPWVRRVLRLWLPCSGMVWLSVTQYIVTSWLYLGLEELALDPRAALVLASMVLILAAVNWPAVLHGLWWMNCFRFPAGEPANSREVCCAASAAKFPAFEPCGCDCRCSA